MGFPMLMLSHHFGAISRVFLVEFWPFFRRLSVYLAVYSKNQLTEFVICQQDVEKNEYKLPYGVSHVNA
jgi:hypothetical protein